MKIKHFVHQQKRLVTQWDVFPGFRTQMSQTVYWGSHFRSRSDATVWSVRRTAKSWMLCVSRCIFVMLRELSQYSMPQAVNWGARLMRPRGDQWGWQLCQTALRAATERSAIMCWRVWWASCSVFFFFCTLDVHSGEDSLLPQVETHTLSFFDRAWRFARMQPAYLVVRSTYCIATLRHLVIGF